MMLWVEWFRCVRLLRLACGRDRTFMWMTLALAGMSIRPDQAGVTSFVRALWLKPETYHRLLHLFHTPGLALDRLTELWTSMSTRLFTPVRVNGRQVVIGDGLKVPKEGRRMPAVKKLHQESQDNSKASYIFGHSFQALGLLVSGPLGQFFCVPLVSRIHEGLVFTNRDRRTLLDKFAAMFVDTARSLEPGALLVADAYYASRKVIAPLLAAGLQLLTRVRHNAVAYLPAPAPAKRRRGRPKVYGKKVRLRDLWRRRELFLPAPSPVYGESAVTLRYHAVDLLWRPVGHLVRFVLVDHPARGRLILMTTDLTMAPLDMIACYGLRFKIEVAFKQALHTMGAYAYHFWMKTMEPRPRKTGNQHLHRTSDEYRRGVRRKMDAYHRYVQLGCIAQGLLQHLALNAGRSVWRHFRSWLRTMNPAAAPSEAVVAQALRDTLPDFLLKAPAEHDLKKFVAQNADFSRCPEFQLAA